MSASLSTSAVTAVSAITGGASSILSSTRTISNVAGAVNQLPNVNTNAALFREIHKNTWLKRLTADGKKITVGPKKSERSWVVFCVHDDCQALLEGYAEPRQAASHNPEWVVSMQETQHISHALIPNSHEFEFVVTLQNEVVRFHAMSWEVMQEWVETLRSKLREMKILSPRENLYTKLPEIRAPLLPTRDPTSPLPATPPVPAALVPGVERVVPQSVLQSVDETSSVTTNAAESSSSGTNVVVTSTTSTSANYAAHSAFNLSSDVTTQAINTHPPTPALTSMSNTLTQNLINMLSNPITAYSELLQEADISRTSNSSDADTMSESGLITEYDFNVDQSAAALGTKPNNFSNECAVGGSFDSNSVRLDIGTFDRLSLDSNETLEDLIQCERLIPRPQTSRSLSAGAADSERRQIASKTNAPQNLKCTTKTSSNSNNNITELEIVSVPYTQPASTTTTSMLATTSEAKAATKDSTTNITIIQVTNSNEQNQFNSTTNNQTNLCSAADIFKFPENAETSTVTNTKYEDFYKSNVQINPSSLNNSTIQVGEPNAVTAVANQYSTPVKRILPQKNKTNLDANTVSSIATSSTAISTPRSHLENHKITTVLVGNQSTLTTPASMYGTCYNSSEATPVASASPALKKKIILSANTSGVTNISVNNAEVRTCDDLITIKSDANDDGVKYNVGNVRYEKVFLSSSMPIAVKQEKNEASTATNANAAQSSSRLTMSPKFSSPHLQPEASSSSSSPLKNERYVALNTSSLPSSPTAVAACSALVNKNKQQSNKQQSANLSRNNLKYAQSASSQDTEMATTTQAARSPASQRKRTPLAAASTNSTAVGPKTPPVPARARFLTRGLTEAVITARPSRKDFCSTKSAATAALANPKADNRSNATTSMNNNEESTKSTSGNSSQQTHENSAIHRTRSESLEQRRRSSSTSEAQSHKTRATNNNEFLSNRIGPSAMRMQQPPHPVSAQPSAVVAGPSASKRMTLREQQVMQLRREIMHPGGVRLQLRRKDCIGSIAWVDAFGAVWVAGWKQKEHPVLYNALHIGDQLISIAGVAISVAADANKVIRNTNTLFVEVLIRRIPLGRGYAIRREREGQCLGLIRDGNTSTIVDVVPNSLAAKHGLPPKAQSCDGSTLTFWVLTEINGRPLNLFFKENEIRDRLNSVGRDISILVQPSDLITKLKKQLKSLRGYKDYLVQ